MPALRTLQRSFAGGEMSPSMFSRVDDIRFQNGFGPTLNYEVLPNGSLTRRPGLRHIRRCKYNTKRCRLVPFAFSVDQTMQVEMGEGYFRFHQNGGTLLWATPPLVIASTSDPNDTIKFTARHGLASNTAVQFTASAGGTLPAGLTEGTTYYVKTSDPLADAKTIQVSAAAGPGATLPIGAIGTGTSRMWRASEMPPTYFTSRNFDDTKVTPGTDVIDLTTAHGFAVGDAVRFTNTGGALPVAAGGGLTAGVTYYVIVASATTIKLARTFANALIGTGAAVIDITSAAGGGTHTIHRFYTQGDLVHWLGAGFGIFYCRSDVANNVAPPSDTPHWYRQPDEGPYEVPNQYLESELAGITYDQSNDIITLAHKDAAIGTFTTTGDTDIDPTNDRITETAHGMVNGQVLTVATSGAFPAATPALATGTSYYVVQAETDTFKIALTPNGTPIDITADAAAGTTLTWTKYGWGLSELRRSSALRWTFVLVSFAPQLSAPVISSVTPVFGAYQEWTQDGATPTLFTTVNSVAHGLSVGEIVYLESVAGGIGQGGSLTGFTAGFHEISHVGAPAPGVAPVDLKLKTLDGGAQIAGVAAGNVYMRFASPTSENAQRYRVTAVTEAGLESQPSDYFEKKNNLSVPGSSNVVTWAAVTGAARYHVYKKDQGTDGSYGYIGKADSSTSTVTFKDENIAPDMRKSLTVLDTTLGAGAGNSPAAVTHFEQRRFFGGTNALPNGIWSTRSGTETDLSSHIPEANEGFDFASSVRDDDRLKFAIASNQAVTIRHLVPLRQLLVLTNATEFRIDPVDSEVLTPSSLSVRAHSYQGCSVVRPVVASNNLVFVSERGGHVFEIGYASPNGGLSDPGDLCLRSAHLFDGLTIEDEALSKAPHQIVWFCSPDSSRLLGITYVPQEQIGAWHAHSTAASGVFESCSVTAEGDEDARYFVVKRTIGGSTVRSIEMMSTERIANLASAYFVDAGGSFDGRNTDGTATMTVTGGTTWGYGDAVTITANAIQFTLGSDDVGDEVVLYDTAGTAYRIRITAVTSNTVATGTLLATLPVSLRSAATSTWAFARDTISGLDHLEGQTVQVFGDSLVQATKVVTSGAISPATPAVRGCVGLGYPSPVTLLPVALQIAEAFGQGRTKNINQAAIRVVDSGTGSLRIGPNSGIDDDLVPANVEAVAGTSDTGEIRVTLLPDWSPDGQVKLIMEDPLPLTLLGIVLQVAVGD